jgi:hypothetical protein
MRVQLLLVAFGVFVWLLTVFLSAWRKHRQRSARLDAAPHVPPVLPRLRALPPPRIAAPRGTPLSALAPHRAMQQRAHSPLGSRRDVRRGIVLMTILGPCRSLEPPEPPW